VWTKEGTDRWLHLFVCLFRCIQEQGEESRAQPTRVNKRGSTKKKKESINKEGRNIHREYAVATEPGWLALDGCIRGERRSVTRRAL
jgi:hypothetical protein